MSIERYGYSVNIAQPKVNGQKLTSQDLINIGYLAGRCGINLNNNLMENPKPKFSNNKVMFSINSCTKDVFENAMTNSGIHFDTIA